MIRENDRYYGMDLGESTPTRSSSIRARSESIARRVNEENYTSGISNAEVDSVIFDVPTSRHSSEMIDEYRRRNRRLPDTDSDRQIRRPRYPVPVSQAPKQRLTRRKVLAGAVVGIAAIAIGAAALKSNEDDITARESAGMFGHKEIETIIHGSQQKRTRLEAWLELDYHLVLLQVNAGNFAQHDIKAFSFYPAYQGPIKNTLISIDLQISQTADNKNMLSVIVSSPFKMIWELVDNGKLFVDGSN